MYNHNFIALRMNQTAPKVSNKKNRIIKIAAKLFREKGYAATSMRDLAEQVGVEAASLYNHINSKAQILDEIIEKTVSQCTENLEEIESSNESYLKKIEGLIRFHTRMMIFQFEEYSVMVSEWMHLEPKKLANFAKQRKEYVRRMETIVQQGIAAGEIKPLMPYVVVLNILSSVRGLEFWHRSSKIHSAKKIEEHMVKHLLTGLTH